MRRSAGWVAMLLVLGMATVLAGAAEASSAGAGLLDVTYYFLPG